MINLQSKTLLGLVTALTLLMLLTFTLVLKQWQSDWLLTHQSIAPTRKLTIENGEGQLIASLPEQHLFGKAISKMGDVPMTNLQLRVTGIVKFNSEQKGNISKAYISIAHRPSKIYQVGDSLPYGVKVYAIASHAVILENNGQLEKLLLPRKVLQFKKFNADNHSEEKSEE